jgi:CHAT domain-containing protein
LTVLINGFYSQTQSKPKILAVALPLESGLPCAQKEIDKIEKCVQGFPILKLIESKATVENVEKGMQECTWAHFACHGIQNSSTPTKSALLLAENTCLTLLNISKLSLPYAEFAYLSACQTATGADNLSEEAVHLTAGMLLAGYRGVIGIMWSIIDQDAPKIADAVYTHIFKESPPDSTQAAFALHETMKTLCKTTSLLSWVPYIHVGI